jgi:hypothetical protein
MHPEIITRDDLKLLRKISEATKGRVPVESMARLAFLGGLELLVNEFLPSASSPSLKLRQYRNKLTSSEVREVRKSIAENWNKLTDKKIGQAFKPPISASVVRSHRKSLGFLKRKTPKASVN